MKTYVVPTAITAATILGLALSRSKTPEQKTDPAAGGAEPGKVDLAREAYLVKSASELVALARQNLRGVDPAVMLSIANELDRDYKTHRTQAGALRAWAKCAADAIADPTAKPTACGPRPYTGLGAGQPVAPAGGAGTPGILPTGLAARIEYMLNPGFPQISLAPINLVIAELAKYQGFEEQKKKLEKRKNELKAQGL